MARETHLSIGSISLEPEASTMEWFAPTWPTPTWLTPMLRYAAFYDVPPGGGFGPRYIQDYQLLVFQKGQGQIVIEDGTYEICGGDAIFTGPNVRHQVTSSVQAPLRMVGLHFLFQAEDNPRLEPFPDFHCPHPFESVASPSPLVPELATHLTLGADNEVGRICEAIVSSYLNDARGRTMEKQGLLLHAFQAWHDAMRRQSAPGALSPRYRRLMEECRRLLMADLRNPPSAAQLAEHADLAPAYFALLFKKYTGSSVNAFVKQQRLQESRRLLIQGRLSVKEVAVSVGFQDPLYFSRLFARHYGFPPSALRNGNLAPPGTRKP